MKCWQMCRYNKAWISNVKEGNTMNVSEWQDRQADNDKRIAKYFEGTLKPSNKKIIRKMKEDVRI